MMYTYRLYTVSMSPLYFSVSTPSLYHDTYGTAVYRTIPCLYYIIQYRHIYIVSQHAISYLYTVSMSSVPSLYRLCRYISIPYDMVPYRTVNYHIIYYISYGIPSYPYLYCAATCTWYTCIPSLYHLYVFYTVSVPYLYCIYIVWYMVPYTVLYTISILYGTITSLLCRNMHMIPVSCLFGVLYTVSVQYLTISIMFRDN